MRDHPSAAVDWQAAVDAAMRILVLASARRYGLIHTPSQTNEKDAKRILEMGRQRQFVPTPDDSERFLTGVICKERKRLCRLLMIGLEPEEELEPRNRSQNCSTPSMARVLFTLSSRVAGSSADLECADDQSR